MRFELGVMNLPALFLALVAVLTVPAGAQKTEKSATKEEVSLTKERVLKVVTPEEAEKLIKAKPNLVILDVRTEEEFADGHLARAMNMSVLNRDFAAQASTLEGQPILVHCAAGGRSTRALQVLKEKKFPEIYHLTSGYVGWIDAGKPVEKGASKPGAAVSAEDSKAAK